MHENTGWINREFSLQLFETNPCKTSWQAEFTCFIWGGQMRLTIMNYINKYTAFSMAFNAVVILNTSLLWCVSAWTDLYPENDLFSWWNEDLSPSSLLLDDSVFPFACLCRPWAIHYLCLPGCVFFITELNMPFKFQFSFCFCIGWFCVAQTRCISAIQIWM